MSILFLYIKKPSRPLEALVVTEAVYDALGENPCETFSLSIN